MEREETYCTDCIHNEVCTYKEVYLKSVSAIRNASYYEKIDDRHAQIRVSNFDFITIKDPECIHHFTVKSKRRDL